MAEDFARVERRWPSRPGEENREYDVPRSFRANPFNAAQQHARAEGERWVPVHGIVRHSDAKACWEAIEAVFAARADAFAKHGVETGYLVTTLSTTGFLIEPVFLWPEALFALHEEAVEKSWLDRLPRHSENPKATAVVAEARRRL